MAIWQDLVDRHGFSGAYESVKRFVQKLRGTTSPEACAVILTELSEGNVNVRYFTVDRKAI